MLEEKLNLFIKTESYLFTYKNHASGTTYMMRFYTSTVHHQQPSLLRLDC